MAFIHFTHGLSVLFSSMVKGAIIILLISSCVSQKQYSGLQSEKESIEEQLSEVRSELEQARHDIDDLRQQLKSLREDSAQLTSTASDKTERLQELEGEYQELETYYNNLLKNSGKLNKDMARQQEDLMTLKESLEQTRRENQALEQDLALREQKVKELERVLAEKDEAARALKKRVSDALLNFKESDLTVTEKDGKIYVSLAEQLLFKSGSIDIDAKGVKALGQLAQALKDQNNLEIMVEGHTDNIPVSKVSKYMGDNWDLSVMRATSIVKILVKNGVEPKHVTAAGKGEYSPLNENDTPEGRQKNRRTDIVITPDLGALFQLLNTDG